MIQHPRRATRSSRRAGARRALAALQQLLESHGWLVFRDARERSPFDLVALPSARSSPVSRQWPTDAEWVGVVASRVPGERRFEPGELRDLAAAHGGRACFLALDHDDDPVGSLSW